jgi:hypothetical protein
MTPEQSHMTPERTQRVDPEKKCICHLHPLALNGGP